METISTQLMLVGDLHYCDHSAPSLQSISKRRKSLKCNVCGFFVSLGMFICSSACLILSFVLLLVGLGTLNTLSPVLIPNLPITLSLLIVQCILFDGIHDLCVTHKASEITNVFKSELKFTYVYLSGNLMCMPLCLQRSTPHVPLSQHYY